MAIKEVIFLEGNIKAYICDEFYSIIERAMDYDPLRWNKRKLQPVLRQIIKPGVIDLNTWKSFVALWKRYSVHLSYGFYDPYNNYIFLNLQTLGIKASTDCSIYTKPSSNTYQFISQIAAHELIHYTFQNNLIKIYSFVRQLLYTFYNTIWSQILDDSLFPQVADINFNIGMDMNINVIDKQLAIAARTNMSRFVSILNKLTNSAYVKDRELLQETIDVIMNVIYGQRYSISKKLEDVFKLAYISIYNDYPKSLLFGQELVYSSEILATATEIKSPQALTTVRRILDNLEVR